MFAGLKIQVTRRLIKLGKKIKTIKDCRRDQKTRINREFIMIKLWTPKHLNGKALHRQLSNRVQIRLLVKANLINNMIIKLMSLQRQKIMDRKLSRWSSSVIPQSASPVSSGTTSRTASPKTTSRPYSISIRASRM